MELSNRLFLGIILLNVFFLALNAFTLLSMNWKGMSGNAAAGFAIIIVTAFIVLLVHLGAIVVIYFTRSVATLYVVTVLAGACTIFSVSVLVSKTMAWQRERGYLNMIERKHQDYLTGVGVSQDSQHGIFTRAIAADDSMSVLNWIESGMQVHAGDLKFASELFFVHGRPISMSIFKMLIDNYPEPQLSDEIIELVLYFRKPDQKCDRTYVEVVELFLIKDLRFLPDRAFPLVCVNTLQLLLDKGVDVNLLTTTNYTYHETTRQEVNYFPKWTPVMLYLNAFPNYFDQTKLLLKYNPDLWYEDENGYSLEEILEKKMVEYNGNAESNLVQNLTEIQRMMEDAK